jgi:Ni,Fe-hydrogenase III component G
MTITFHEWACNYCSTLVDKFLLLFDGDGEIMFSGYCRSLHYHDQILRIKNYYGQESIFKVNNTIQLNYSRIYDSSEDLDTILAELTERIRKDLKIHADSISRFRNRRKNNIFPRTAEYIVDYEKGDMVYSFYPEDEDCEGVYYSYKLAEIEDTVDGQVRFQIEEIDEYSQTPSLAWIYVAVGKTKENAKYNYYVQDSKRFYEIVDFANKVGRTQKSLIEFYVKEN